MRSFNSSSIPLALALSVSACGEMPSEETSTGFHALEASEEADIADPTPPGDPGEPAEEYEAFSIKPVCDKVTTFVCPGDGCLCAQMNCSDILKNGTFVPCAGPPFPGCQHDFLRRFCYPPGLAIQCDSRGVPVNPCGLPCESDPNVKYTVEAGGCCRGERKCLPPP